MCPRVVEMGGSLALFQRAAPQHENAKGFRNLALWPDIRLAVRVLFSHSRAISLFLPEAADPSVPRLLGYTENRRGLKSRDARLARAPAFVLAPPPSRPAGLYSLSGDRGGVRARSPGECGQGRREDSRGRRGFPCRRGPFQGRQARGEAPRCALSIGTLCRPDRTRGTRGGRILQSRRRPLSTPGFPRRAKIAPPFHHGVPHDRRPYSLGRALCEPGTDSAHHAWQSASLAATAVAGRRRASGNGAYPDLLPRSTGSGDTRACFRHGVLSALLP